MNSFMSLTSHLVVVALCLSLAFCSYLPTLTTEEVNQILASEGQSNLVVKCILKYNSDCEPRLKRISEVAPEIFEDGGKCNDCSPEEQKIVRKFLIGLQKDHPSAYKELRVGLEAAVAGGGDY